MTPEEQRAEEQAAIEREHLAFERKQAAWSAVHRQFLPFGNGAPTGDAMDEFEAAEAEWREAQADMVRIAEEIRSGKRR